MNLAVALCTFALFNLIKGFEYFAPIAVGSNEGEEVIENGNNSEASAANSLPRYVFLGTKKWPRILELQASPFIFISAFELELNAFHTNVPGIRLGLFLAQDEVCHFKRMSQSQLDEVLKSLKVTFEFRTSRILQHCLYDCNPGNKLVSALEANGLVGHKAVMLDSDSDSDEEHFCVDTGCCKSFSKYESIAAGNSNEESEEARLIIPMMNPVTPILLSLAILVLLHQWIIK